MVQTLIWFSSLTGLYLFISQYWSALELPFIEFITLGRIPGTDIYLQYSDVLWIGLGIFVFLWALERLSYQKPRLRNLKEIELLAI